MTNNSTSEKQAIGGKFRPGNKIGPRFAKGVSGNPRGRARITKVTEAIRAQLAEQMPNAPEETMASAIAGALLREAVSGNVMAIKEVCDRSEGRSPVTLDVGVKDDQPLKISFDFHSSARLLTDGNDD